MANEKRLIDANFTKAAIQNYIANNEVTEAFVEIAGHICSMLDACETVDAVEVVHGRWERAEEFEFISGEYVTTGYHCNKCGCYYKKKSNYCPNCGSLMDGGGEQ